MPNKRVVTGQLTGRLYQQRRETQPWKTDSAAGKRSPSSNKSKRAAARCAWPLRSTEAPVLLAGGLARDSPRGPRRDKPSGSSCRSRHAPGCRRGGHLVQAGFVAWEVGTNRNGYNSEPTGPSPAVEDLESQGRRGAPALVPRQFPPRAAGVGLHAAVFVSGELSGFTWLTRW